MSFDEYRHLKIVCSNPKIRKTLAEQYELDECFYEQIDGNESFVLYDIVKQKIIAVRDFFGLYPLYYTTIAGEIRFSDSINDLLSFWQEENNRLPNINLNRLVDYVTTEKHVSVIDNETFFEGIFRLLPAHVMVVEAGKETIYSPYKKIDIQPYQGLDDETYIEKFRDLFVTSVKRNIDGYHSIASHVSGGLDSSSVACVAQSLHQEQVMTLHLNPCVASADEQHYADLVPKKWHTRHLNFPSPTNFYETMERAIQLSALPETANLPFTFLSPLVEACREAGTEILLSGHCGDQVVGNWREYFEDLYKQQNWQALKTSLQQWQKDDVKVKKYATKFLLSKLKSKPSFTGFLRTAWVLVRHFGIGGKVVLGLWQDRKKDKLIYSGRNILRSTIKKSGTEPKVLDVAALVNATLTPQQEHQMKSFYSTLSVEYYEVCNQLYKHDSKHKTKMGFPFLDQELIALSLNVPNKLRFGEGKTRGIIRQAMSEYLPKEIAGRTTKVLFNDYSLLAFKSMYATFKHKNAANYDLLEVWQYIDQQAFEQFAADIIAEGSKVSSKQALIATRTIYLSIWLEYLESINKLTHNTKTCFLKPTIN